MKTLEAAVTENPKPTEGTAFNWVVLVIACAAVLLFAFADWKQAGTQYSQFSVVRSVR